MCIYFLISPVKWPKMAIKEIQKFGIILEDEVIFLLKKFWKIQMFFSHWKLTLKVRFWALLTDIFSRLTSTFDEKINTHFVICAILASFWNVSMTWWIVYNWDFLGYHTTYLFEQIITWHPDPRPYSHLKHILVAMLLSTTLSASTMFITKCMLCNSRREGCRCYRELCTSKYYSGKW